MQGPAGQQMGTLRRTVLLHRGDGSLLNGVVPDEAKKVVRAQVDLVVSIDADVRANLAAREGGRQAP